ncbi:MAG: hypothetical protein AB7O59_24715 [Pirellulales bacterium]
MTPFARITWIVSCVIAVVCLCNSRSAAQAADDKADVSGTWNCQVDIAGNQGTPTFTIKQEGDKLTGKYAGQFGEADLTGTIKGKDIEFSFEIQAGAKAVYKGTVDGKAMKGTCDYAGQAEGTWTAKLKE